MYLLAAEFAKLRIAEQLRYAEEARRATQARKARGRRRAKREPVQPEIVTQPAAQEA
jgi:hypothetical protein